MNLTNNYKSWDIPFLSVHVMHIQENNLKKINRKERKKNLFHSFSIFGEGQQQRFLEILLWNYDEKIIVWYEKRM